MVLDSKLPLTEISTRNISWRVKAAGAYGWQPYHLQVPAVLKSESLKLLEPSGSAQVCDGITFLTLPLATCAKVAQHNQVLASPPSEAKSPVRPQF